MQCPALRVQKHLRILKIEDLDVTLQPFLENNSIFLHKTLIYSNLNYLYDASAKTSEIQEAT